MPSVMGTLLGARISGVMRGVSAGLACPREDFETAGQALEGRRT